MEESMAFRITMDGAMKGIKFATKEEAIENAKEAIRGYITALEEDNLIVPEDKFDALLGAV